MGMIGGSATLDLSVVVELGGALSLNKYTITGQTPSKKNSRAIGVRNGRMVNFPNKRYQQWEKDALWEVKRIPKFSGKVRIEYFFYCQDKRRRDVDNMIASVNDLLIKGGIIEDDDWQHLEIGGATGQLDKANPRVEITIETARETS